MSESKDLKVFISSTSEDLKAQRTAAIHETLRFGWQPIGMENMDASTTRALEACLTDLLKCQLVILIVAWRKGWAPTKVEGGDGEMSITALEFNHALKHNIPVLIMVGDDKSPELS